MTSYVALLRAVNLGAASTLRMADLKAIANALCFARARTYIASGNLLFEADLDETAVKAALEARLRAETGRAIGVVIRTAAELAEMRNKNPFAAAPGNRVVAILLDAPPPSDAIEQARHVAGEQMALGPRVIYVRYTDTGMGRSKLVLPAAKTGTARNMNTIAKLAELAVG